jgi:hypothetical protein
LHERIVAAAPYSTLERITPQRASELRDAFAVYHQQLQFLPRRIRRRLQQKWKQSLAGLALLLALGAAPALAATIQLDETCTLGRAITSTNNDFSAGGCSPGNGADTIIMSARSTQAVALINNNAPDYGPTGLPIVSSTITIDGNDSTITRASGAPSFTSWP